MNFITLDADNIDNEHICCAFSDKKCTESYALKKDWLKQEFQNGYVFRRLDARAKVFIEYGPAEKAWAPVAAPGYMLLGCFWVSGKYKGLGNGKTLLQHAIDDAKAQGKAGLAAIVGTKKYHFMSDTKWLLRQGFTECDTTPAGFSLLSLDFGGTRERPAFAPAAKSGECPEKKGYVAYYSNRCPYAEYHVAESLAETMAKRNLPYKAIKLKTMKEAQACPSPATIFSLFRDGKFITTDLSACMDSRFDKVFGV